MKVIKRDGQQVDFSLTTIINAINKAMHSCGIQAESETLERLALRVQSHLEKQVVDVETIQDLVEQELSLCGYPAVAKAYILYRKQRELLRLEHAHTEHFSQMISDYLQGEVKHFSLANYIFQNSGAMTQTYWLNHVYDNSVAKAHTQGDLYIHDLDMLSGDSAGWDLSILLKKGIVGLGQHPTMAPAKDLAGFCDQLAMFINLVQNEWAGAMCIPHFDTTLATLVHQQGLNLDQVSSCLETFIYACNQAARWGGQAPFTVLGFDWQADAASQLVQEAYFKLMEKGDALGNPFMFPISHVDWKPGDCAANEALFNCMAKFGNIYIGKPGADKAVGYFGHGANQASYGTVTLNLVRLAFLNPEIEDFYAALKRLLTQVDSALTQKRTMIERLFHQGFFPYTREYMPNGQWIGTVGLLGLKALSQYLPDLDIDQLLATISKWVPQYQLELVPGMQACERLALLDQQMYPDQAKRLARYDSGLSISSTNLWDKLIQASLRQQHINGGSCTFVRQQGMDSISLQVLARKIYDKINLRTWCYVSTFEVNQRMWSMQAGFLQPFDEWPKSVQTMWVNEKEMEG